MRKLGGGAKVAVFGGRVGQVHLDALNQRAECRYGLALAATRHTRQHVGCQLQVPGVIEFASFHHRATGCGRVTTPLERHGGKGRLVGLAVVGVGNQLRHVVRTKLLHHERAGADRVEVLCRTGRCFVAQAVLELRPLHDGCGGPAKHIVRIGLGGLESDAHSEVVHRDNLVYRGESIGLGTALDAGAVFVAEHHIRRGQRRAVGPFEAAFEFVGDGLEISRKTTIGHGWHGFGQRRDHLAVLVELDQRVHDQRRCLEVLGATGEVGVQDRRRLPVDHVDVATGAALGHGSLRQRHQRAQS